MELTGWKRYELNTPMRFSGVTKDLWGAFRGYSGCGVICTFVFGGSVYPSMRAPLLIWLYSVAPLGDGKRMFWGRFGAYVGHVVIHQVDFVCM